MASKLTLLSLQNWSLTGFGRRYEDFVNHIESTDSMIYIYIYILIYPCHCYIFSRPPSLAWHSKLLIHHSYSGEESVLFARSNLPYSFSMQLRSIAASLGATPVTQFRGRAASQFTVVVSRAERPFTVKERQLVRNAICSCP